MRDSWPPTWRSLLRHLALLLRRHSGGADAGCEEANRGDEGVVGGGSLEAPGLRIRGLALVHRRDGLGGRGRRLGAPPRVLQQGSGRVVEAPHCGMVVVVAGNVMLASAEDPAQCCLGAVHCGRGSGLGAIGGFLLRVRERVRPADDAVAGGRVCLEHAADHGLVAGRRQAERRDTERRIRCSIGRRRQVRRDRHRCGDNKERGAAQLLCLPTGFIRVHRHRGR
mmetsp:Transcript_11744/g.33816  ORF Transcript_11744/g.33816 Transcript_11744/m.33816 type:complete len:224 (+) Transcript_11744:56-727(+)